MVLILAVPKGFELELYAFKTEKVFWAIQLWIVAWRSYERGFVE
jgi:hypothetical protein